MRKKTPPSFILWMISFILCMIIEFSVQTYDGIIGTGIIAAIFMFFAMLYDLLSYLNQDGK